MKRLLLIPLLAIFTGCYASVEGSPVEPRACVPTPLRNGDFESGSLDPWTISPEYETAKRAAAVTANAYAGKFAARLTLVYQPYDKPNREAPLVYFGQNLNPCGAPTTFTYYYKIKPDPQYDNSLLAQIYDSNTHEVYVYDYITFNDTAVSDSEHNEYGQWHKRTFSFTPTKYGLVFGIILDGDFHGHDGTSHVFVDNVSFVKTPT